MNIFIARGNETFGPYNDEQLSQYLSTGEILLTDLCCAEGNETWQPLYRLNKPCVLPQKSYQIARDGAGIGEARTHELIAGVDTQRFLRTDHFWTQGQANWLPLSHLFNEDAKEYVIVERGGAHHGPYGPTQVQEYLEGGQLSCQDRAWVPGLRRWTTIQGLLEFLGIELEYYIERGDQKFGPYSREQLEEYHEAGNLSDGDVVTGTGGYESRGNDFAPEMKSSGSGDMAIEVDDDPLAEINDDDALAFEGDDDGLSDFGDDDALSDDDDDALSDDGGDDGWLSALGDDDD
ncbi:MAG: DUF4339 domain-containing protein [Spirochaetes bacterium]|nr:DUF4339 domain-containing protein [Spirochaetota bacterium]